jgi:antitoxin component YwqK of YwqJK toxin-antitoxin module
MLCRLSLNWGLNSYDSTIYEKGKKITETLLVYHKNHIMAVVSHINFTADTTFESKHYDDSARLATEVSFIGQKGLLKHYDKGNLTSSDSVFSRLELKRNLPAVRRHGLNIFFPGYKIMQMK